MTKRELVSEIAHRTGISKTRVFTVVDEFLETVIEEVSSGGEVRLQGFGSFRTKQRNPKTVRDFFEDRMHVVPGKPVPVFVPSDRFKSMVKEGSLRGKNSHSGG